MAVSSEAPKPSPPAAGLFSLVDETSAVRAAAQWLVAAAGAVGATLVAGLQLGDITKHSSMPWLIAISIASFVVAMVIVGIIIRKASRVLVIGRTTISDILDAELSNRLTGTRRIKLGRPASKAMRTVINQVEANREWLLGHHDSAASLFATYEKSRMSSRLIQAEGTATQTLNDDTAQESGARLGRLCDFARSELARHEYQKLASLVAGTGGISFALAVVVFAVSLGWPISNSPNISSPIQVRINLIGDPAKLARAGIPLTCPPGTLLTGVAIEGSLTEPVVINEAIDTVTKGKAILCPMRRFRATGNIAIVIPILDVK